MPEVMVIARSVARKGKEDQLRALLRGMLTPTRAEPGCRLYELYESGSGGRFYFYETWESQAALDQHAASPHFKHLEQSIGELVAEPFEVNILTEILPATPV
ncbi:MAG: putative quinol monooxygenase [Candidatus Korobacteraceae bacterium]|jgi:quinol monooxygenase YgiN